MIGVTDTAVILAAGMGRRLGRLGTIKPKGLLEIGGIPLIHRSIRILLDHGVRKIILVTGHMSHFYSDVAKKFSGRVVLVHNAKYAVSGSFYSLYVASPLVTSSFILLESDIIYEPRAIFDLLKFNEPDALLLSGPTDSGDEVYVETSNDCLVNMSKDVRELSITDKRELVGISKISTTLLNEMLGWAYASLKESLEIDYERCLVLASRRVPVKCLYIENLVWGEIDCESHLERVLKQVYPKIEALGE